MGPRPDPISLSMIWTNSGPVSGLGFREVDPWRPLLTTIYMYILYIYYWAVNWRTFYFSYSWNCATSTRNQSKMINVLSTNKHLQSQSVQSTQSDHFHDKYFYAEWTGQGSHAPLKWNEINFKINQFFIIKAFSWGFFNNPEWALILNSSRLKSLWKHGFCGQYWCLKRNVTHLLVSCRAWDCKSYKLTLSFIKPLFLRSRMNLHTLCCRSLKFLFFLISS